MHGPNVFFIGTSLGIYCRGISTLQLLASLLELPGFFVGCVAEVGIPKSSGGWNSAVFQCFCCYVPSDFWKDVLEFDLQISLKTTSSPFQAVPGATLLRFSPLMLGDQSCFRELWWPGLGENTRFTQKPSPPELKTFDGSLCGRSGQVLHHWFTRRVGEIWSFELAKSVTNKNDHKGENWLFHKEPFLLVFMYGSWRVIKFNTKVARRRCFSEIPPVRSVSWSCWFVAPVPTVILQQEENIKNSESMKLPTKDEWTIPSQSLKWLQKV